MDHIFVWTFKDVMGLVLVGVIILCALLLWAHDSLARWRKKRKTNKPD